MARLRTSVLLGGASLAALTLLAACSGGETTAAKDADGDAVAKGAATAEPAPPAARLAVQEPLEGGPYPSLLLAQAQFIKGPDGKPKPGPALLTIWRRTPDGWKTVKVEDPDSNVFHKAYPWDGGILTVGAEKAFLKDWTWKDGKWSAEAIWNPKWEGKFNRLRDLEVGDVNGDGAEDFVVASHDYGVIGVVELGPSPRKITELDKQADTFVHEIEIGDIDGDGKKEFFATPSGRNQSSGKSQPGMVVMYKWNGTEYVRSVVDDLAGSHAKEILAVDLTGKGKADLFAVIEAETELVDGKARIVKPVEIRHYTPQKDGTFKHEVAATIDDRQTRFLVPGDFDGDGEIELVAAAMKSGLWVLERNKDGTWASTNIETASGGFEHAAQGADLDGDGKLELYVASDDQGELRSYTYDAASKTYVKNVIGKIQDDSITWNITSGNL